MWISCVEAYITNSLFWYLSLQKGFLRKDHVVYINDTILMQLQIFRSKIWTTRKLEISTVNVAVELGEYRA